MDIGTQQFSGASSTEIPAEALAALGYPPEAAPTEPKTPATQDAPATPRVEASEPKSAPAPASTPAEKPAAPAPEKTEAEWWKSLDGVSDDELATHPKLSGKIGKIADNLVKKRLTEAEAQRAAQHQAELTRQQMAELEQLRYTDPPRYVQREDELRAASNQRAQVYQEVYTPARAVFYTLPYEVQVKLSGKQYPGQPAEAMNAYLQDLISHASEHAVTTARAEWEANETKKIETRVRRELTSAIRKDLASEQSDGERAPDAGSSAPTDDLTFDEDALKKMPIDEYVRKRDRYFAALPGRR